MGHFSCAFVSVWRDYMVFSLLLLSLLLLLLLLLVVLELLLLFHSQRNLILALLCKCVPLFATFFFFLFFSLHFLFLQIYSCHFVTQSFDFVFHFVYGCAINFDFIAAYLLFRALYGWFYQPWLFLSLHSRSVSNVFCLHSFGWFGCFLLVCCSTIYHGTMFFLLFTFTKLPNSNASPFLTIQSNFPSRSTFKSIYYQCEVLFTR